MAKGCFDQLRCILGILPLHQVHFVNVAWNNMDGLVTLNRYSFNANYRHKATYPY